MNPIPVISEPEGLTLAVIFWFIAMGFLLVGALSGVLGRGFGKVGWSSRLTLFIGFLLALFIGYLGRRSVSILIAILPISFVSLVLAKHLALGNQKRSGFRIFVFTASGFLVGVMMSMGLVISTAVLNPWGWSSISLQEFPGVAAFGAGGLCMILLGIAYFKLCGIPLKIWRTS